MSREITKVFCSNRNRIGTVCSDQDGLFIKYTAEILHVDGGVYGSKNEVIERLPDPPGELSPGYCTRCSKVVALDAVALRKAGLDGASSIAFPFAHTADHLWADAGFPPLYPPGMTRGSTDPR
jgi:hypothetical protein